MFFFFSHCKITKRYISHIFLQIMNESFPICAHSSKGVVVDLQILHKNFLLLMSFHVQCQMIRSGKTSFTLNAFERLQTGVFTMVSGQFIRSCKSPFTSFPRTSVWFLTCNKKFRNIRSYMIIQNHTYNVFYIIYLE